MFDRFRWTALLESRGLSHSSDYELCQKELLHTKQEIERLKQEQCAKNRSEIHPKTSDDEINALRVQVLINCKFFFFLLSYCSLVSMFSIFFSHISMNDRCSSSKTSCSGARTSAADHWPMSGNRRPRDATPSKRNWPKRSDRTGLASPSWSTNFRSRGTARWLCSRRKTKSWPIYATCSSKLETVLHQRLITEATLPQPGAQNRGLIRLLLSLP